MSCTNFNHANHVHFYCAIMSHMLSSGLVVLMFIISGIILAPAPMSRSRNLALLVMFARCYSRCSLEGAKVILTSSRTTSLPGASLGLFIKKRFSRAVSIEHHSMQIEPKMGVDSLPLLLILAWLSQSLTPSIGLMDRLAHRPPC